MSSDKINEKSRSNDWSMEEQIDKYGRKGIVEQEQSIKRETDFDVAELLVRV